MLFRRIKAHIEKENWFAVGVDFLIVVVGVYIGIALGNLNDTRKDDQRRQAALLMLQEQAEDNIGIVARHYTNLREAALLERNVAIALNKGVDSVDTTDLNNAFARVMYFSTVALNRAPYDALQQSGDLALIEDPDILIGLNEFNRTADWVLSQHAAFHTGIRNLQNGWETYLFHSPTDDPFRTNVNVPLGPLLADPIAVSNFTQNARMKAIFTSYLRAILRDTVMLCEQIASKTGRPCEGADTVLESL